MRLRGSILAVAAMLLAACNSGGGHDGRAGKEELRLNQMQVLATHNSYHPYPAGEPTATLVRQRLGALADIVDYRHPTLEQQLDIGVRSFELDVWSDPDGGNYARRPLLDSVGGDPETGIAELEEPGLKVLHIAQIDAESTCWTFIECLQQLKRWSDAHPLHAPIMVMIEIKDIDFFGTAEYVPITPWVAADYDNLDREIRSVFPPDRLVTPDDVQGGYSTLEAAVLAKAWPTLAESRGKFLFTSCNCLAADRQRKDYIRADGSLKDRVLFPSSRPGNPDAAFILLDDPKANFDQIQQLVAAGYIVRTRADANTKEARANDRSTAEAAFASGAQFVSTDYEQPDATINPDYEVRVPDGTPTRCNPISAPAACRSTGVENLSAVQ
jgi:hypothetical protein